MAEIIEFPGERPQESSGEAHALWRAACKMHDDEGYCFVASMLNREDDGLVVLTFVLEKPTPDDIPDITA